MIAQTKSKGKSKAKALFSDSMIREVRINYQSTQERPFAIRQADDVASFVRRVLCDNSREHAIALYLDGAHQVASFSIISIGTANSALVHPREVFQRAIGAGAVSLVIAHNHPSGQREPSSEDRSVTRQLKEAGELLGIRLLDHVIVTEQAYYSFREEGIL